MTYRVRPHLWELLMERERTAAWLARRAGYTPQYLRLLRSGKRSTVSEAFASRVAAVLGVPVTDLFAPIEEGGGAVR